MKSVRSVDLSGLPRYGNKGKISWFNSVGCSFDFEYDGIFGSCVVSEYNSSKGSVILEYYDYSKVVTLGDLAKCNISFVKDVYNRIHDCDNTTTKWSKNEIDILISNYSNKDIFEISKMLPNRTKEAITTMARRKGLKKTELHMRKISVQNLGEYAIQKDGTTCKKAIPIDGFCGIFKRYKYSLDNDCKFVIGDVNVDRNSIILLFKYYLKKNNIKHDKRYWTECIIGKVLSKAKLKQRVKNNFNGYYDFITHCFPKYKFKEWEFKYLNVSDNFWSNKFNRFHCIRNSLQNMLDNKMIKEIYECLYFDPYTLHQMFHSSLMTYFGKGCIIEYFEFIKYDTPVNLKYYDGVYFDSIEERNVYEFICENFNIKINKCDRSFKFSNTKNDERYIPDFAITEINGIKVDKDVIVEYFGMYKDSMNTGHFGEYKRKTDRKIDFYKSNENIYFISLFPTDITHSFKGVRDKLTSFIMQLKLERG